MPRCSTRYRNNRRENPLIRVGIIGTGFIADSHAGAIAGSPRTTLTAIHDRAPEAAQRFISRWGGVAMPDAEALISSAEVDAVIVCTPNDTHVDLAMAACRHGKHVLIEKPIALEPVSARAMTDAFAAAGLVFQAGHVHRHTDLGRAVQDCITSGALGTIEAIRIAITGGWIWPGWQGWVLDHQRSGGHALHNGVHLYDLASWWLHSPIVKASALGQQLTSGRLAIDDALVATLVAESGASAICEISRGERPRATALFEVVVQGSAGSLVRAWSSDGGVAFTDEASGPLAAAFNDPFRLQLDSWADAILDGRPVNPSLSDAVQSVAVADAVTRAARSNRVEEVAR
ncbi:hypothetical protein CGZ97_16690 [Enemella evansiae]|nr:hypothetical protein CGZ97_16690 [Enemella evansiae]